LIVEDLWIDLETYSEIPLSNGLQSYAEGVEIILFLYAIGDGDVNCLDFTQEGCEMPDDLVHAIKTAKKVWAQNTYFDRTILNKCLPQFDWSIPRWRDTMIQAATNGLPAGLDGMGTVMGLDDETAKDKGGKNLIHLFCKPRPANHKLRRATWETHPVEWQQFVHYGVKDIKAMRECHKRMPKVNYPNSVELDFWHLDQKINDRGFCVDVDLVNAAILAVQLEAKSLKKQVIKVTDGELDSTTKRDATLKYLLESYGVSLPDLKKGTLERRLEDQMLPEEVKELIRIRLQASSSSTSKFARLGKAVGKDGRCRGTIQFYGAKRTGRAAGRVFQPQNLPSRGLLSHAEIAFGIQALKDGDALEYFPNMMKLLTSVIRSCVIAAPGKKLVVSDLSNIEGRVAAWVTGEDWKLRAFRDFDEGRGVDQYKLAYAKAFQVDAATVTKPQRDIGKVLELMMGYGGGVGAFVTGALGYGFDLEEMAKRIWETLPETEVHKARAFLEWVRKHKRPTYDLSDEAFITCDVLKRLWRNSNFQISSYWKQIEDAFVAAVNRPGRVIKCGPHIHVVKVGAWLRIRLPSGRVLSYPSATVEIDLKFFGENPYTRQWQRLTIWGGTLFENICQAIARDVLYYAMPRAEALGYEIILHVHDELIAEVDDNKEHNVEELSSIMVAGENWTKGLPLAAAGFETYAFRK